MGATEFGPSGEIIFRTINAAAAKVQGVDADFNFRPHSIAGLSINGAVNYNKAKYTSFPNAICANGQTISEGCNQLFSPAKGRFTAQNLTGRPLVRAPVWSGNVGLDYRFPVGVKVDLSVGSTASFSSKYYNNLVDLPGYVQGSFAKLGGNITLKSRDDGWEIALIGNNLTNKLVASSCANANPQNGTVLGGLISGAPSKGPAGSDEPVCVVDRGRELWLRVGFHF